MAIQIFHPPVAAARHVAIQSFSPRRHRSEIRSRRRRHAGNEQKLPAGGRPKPATPSILPRRPTAVPGTGDRVGLTRGYENRDDVKKALHRELEGINRGIFGASSEKKGEIEGLVRILESMNPTPCPTDDLQKVDGCWKLLYSTITILGSKRTKLGLRDFITLGDFLQTIDVAQWKAINEIKFNARGFKMLSGRLSIVASYEVASKTRVNIKFENSDIAPEQLMDLFKKSYDLLLGIFNPDGWLEITYLDQSMRIGRDDKGNIFVLERFKQDEDYISCVSLPN